MIHAKKSNIPVPEIMNSSEYKITLEEIKGKKLSQHIDYLENKYEIANQIGTTIARMHDLNIIHGDLTTSNMILKEKKEH